MGQFKPMTKMMTTEPSVELKLKKGGQVKKGAVKMQMGGVPPGMPAGMPPGPVGAGRIPLAQRLRRRPMPALAGMGAPGAMSGGAPMISPAAMPQEPMVMKKGGMTLKKHANMPASKAHKGLKTGGVIMGQGGYKKGGMVPKSGILPVKDSAKGAEKYVKTKMHGMATGGVVEGKPGGYNTGGVVMGQGGYKKGGAPKKAYATGGLVDSGKPVAMPKKPASKPVSNDRQSGTFKKGGRVYNEGGAAGPDANYARDGKTVKSLKDPVDTAAKAARDLEDAMNPLSIIRELGSKARDKLRGSGSVTETEKSVTVSPPMKKRAGGAC